MSHEEELDRLVRGTELESFVYREAGPQRGGVLGALNMVAGSLKLLPRESDAKQRWTTEEWARQKTGWLFLTSTPRFRERLLPLASLWLDTLVLRLMNQGDPAMRHAWFVLDELASLSRVPNTTHTFTRMTEANFPAASIAKAANARRQRLSSSRLHPRRSQCLCEECGRLKKSKAKV